MPRLSDRAFQLVKEEIDRCYGATPDEQLERVIVLARLENLRIQEGSPLSRIELWETLSDVSAKFDQQVILQAAKLNVDSSVVNTSIGVGAIAVLVAASINADANTANAPVVSDVRLTPEQAIGQSRQAQLTTQADSAVGRAQPIAAADEQPRFVRATQALSAADMAADAPIEVADEVADEISEEVSKADSSEPEPKSAFEMARTYGWQAALKAQNPPHSAAHWAQTAELWQQAIGQLEQVPERDENYAIAQSKKATYQANLRQIQVRQQAAIASETRSSPQFSNAAASEDSLAAAKKFGWQAALASQNAPHPAEKWADISRLWQIALQHLNKVEPDHPDYAEAQQVKAQYQENLAMIRQRYQQAQDASQSLQSLRATLAELETSGRLSGSHGTAQLAAILQRLRTIPAGTVAHKEAQSLIATTQNMLNGLSDNADPKIAISTEER
ncbi:MAG: hypothetical protein AAFY33_12490 [Cyanobacteria bacterium J06643_4]